MNVKQFKRRLVNGLVEPELFYMPVGKKDDAFTIEIEVIKSNVFIEVFKHFVPSGSTSIPYLFNLNSRLLMYNLKDENGIFVNKETYPELFWEFPCHGTDYNKKEEFLSENMIENNVQLYFQIDWGDGEKTIETPVQKTFTIRDHTFTYDTIQATDMSNTASSVDNPYVHMYKETGIYTVKVSGYASNIEIKDCYVPRDKNLYYYNDQKEQYDNGFGRIRWRNIEGQCFVLRNIISWGDLKRRNFYSTFTRAIADMKQFPINLPFKKLSKVVALEYLNGSMWIYNSLWNCDKLGLEMTWEALGGECFFDNFPNLISVNHCFVNSQFTYIPPYCFKNNPYLINAEGCFSGCLLEYVGEYAFANLKYLSNVSNVWYVNIPNELKDVEYHKMHPIMSYIGDSVFENCENISSDNLINDIFVPHSYINFFGWQRIGNRIFKNCKKLTSGSGGNTGWLNLTYIGDELFAGCEKLEKLNNCFQSAPNLEYIGKDIFKGCKKLYDTTGVFRYSFFKINIPEKMFYDVEFQHDVKYNFDFNIDLDHGVNKLREEKNHIGNFFDLTIAFYNEDNFNENYYKELYPELYQKLVYKIQNFDFDITNNTGFHFGKNMFNENFLAELGNARGAITVWTDDSFDGHMDEYEYNNKGLMTKMIIHNRNTGEAPPFWKYGIEPVKFGEIGTGEEDESGVYYSGDLQYDNADEIPKESPWVVIRPFK